MNGAWLAVEARSAPVPQLEGEDVWGGADFQNHAVTARTVNRSSRNQEMIMFACGPFVDVLLGIEPVASLLSLAEFGRHLLSIYIRLKTKVNRSIRRGIKQIVAFVLSVRNTEFFPDVFRQGMDLQRQISTLHSVQEIEADGKLCPKARVYGIAQQFARVLKHEIDRRDLNYHIAEPEAKRVFLGNAVEAPRVVWSCSIQATDFAHPLPSPRSGVEEGNNTERTSNSVLERRTECIAAD